MAKLSAKPLTVLIATGALLALAGCNSTDETLTVTTSDAMATTPVNAGAGTAADPAAAQSLVSGSLYRVHFAPVVRWGESSGSLGPPPPRRWQSAQPPRAKSDWIPPCPLR